jgi:thiamine pyrophosphokinase
VDGCALVLAGGEPVEPALRRELPRADLVVAADSGVHLADVLGVRVDLVVGDLDSAEPEAVVAAEAAGAKVERHPARKDATDLELAIDAAVAAGARRVVVVGGGGGRVDHLFANVLLLGAPEWKGVELEARFGGARVVVARGGEGSVTIAGRPGTLVTLLPVGGAAQGIVTAGLEYPLRRETLAPGASRGVSNVMTGREASVELETGTLLVVQPDSGRGVRS